MLVLSIMSNIQASRVEYILELQVLQATKITDVQKCSGSSYFRVDKNTNKITDNEVLSKGQHQKKVFNLSFKNLQITIFL